MRLEPPISKPASRISEWRRAISCGRGDLRLLGHVVSETVARIRSLVGAISLLCSSISCAGRDVNVVGRAISVTVA